MKKEPKDILAECILKKIKKLIDYAGIGDPIKDYIWSGYTNSGRWYLYKEGIPILNEIYRHFESAFGENICEDDASHIVTSLIQTALFEKDKFNLQVVKDELAKLTTDIRNREYCLAVFGLEIEEGFSLGRVSFFPKGLENQSAIKIDDDVKDSVYSWACFSAEGSQLYMQKALGLIVQKHVNVIEYLHDFIETRYPSGDILHTSHFNKDRAIGLELNRIVGASSFSSSVDYTNKKVKTTISRSTLLGWNKMPIFKKLNSILCVENSLHNKVLNAITFYHEAAIESREDLQILKCIIGIEALLGTQKDKDESRISSNLSEKAAFLLAESYDDRLIVVKEIKDLYTKRSKLSHGETNSEDEGMGDVIAKMYLGKLIAKFIELLGEKDGFNTVSDIDTWFFSKKMG